MEDFDSPSKIPFILVALIILAGLGFGFYKFNPLAPHPPIINWTGNPISRETISFNLDVTNPDDQSLLFDSRLLVSGKTAPNAAVIISRESDTSEIDADKDGNFSENISLSPGLNHLTVVSFNDQGSQKTVTRLVYYSQDQI